MKRLLFLVVFALTAITSLASAENWLTNYDQALGKAKLENKPLLVDFTGLKWCPPCIRLEREVFETKEFKDYAAKNLVLFRRDFPTPDDFNENEKLVRQFNIEHLPTLFMVTPNGSKSEEIEDFQGGPKVFIVALEKVAPKK